MVLNLAKGEDVCVCAYTSGDLLNRLWFQFHASEFDRGDGGGGSLASNVPSGWRGWKEGGGGEREEAGKRTEHGGTFILLVSNTPSLFCMKDTHVG